MTSPLAAFHRANALTYISLLAAIGAVASAARGSGSGAGALIAISVVADTFDGRFARRFRRTPSEQSFGIQLDSLSDAIAFGAAPGLCMALLIPRGTAWAELISWFTFAAFAASAITRLAFYNVTQEVAKGFVGLPVPVAALVWSSMLLLNPSAPLSAIVLLTSAAAMVLPLPIPRPTGLGLAAFVAWPLIVVGAHLAAP